MKSFPWWGSLNKGSSLPSAKYFILVGILLFIMAVSPGIIKKLPFTSSLIYLLVGILLGQHGSDLIDINSLKHSVFIEHMAELTVIISLFTVGLKLRLKLSDKLWHVPISLASFSMVITVGLIAVLGYYFLNLDPGPAILLGAILSPTDPVLASDVQLNNPTEINKRKFIITSEGGMNDGTAFPFIMLGLAIIGAEGGEWSLGRWFLKDLIWAISAGLGIGFLSGIMVNKITVYVNEQKENFYLEDFLTISSIALSYGLALQFQAYGFLAVFANALTVRQLELKKNGTKNVKDDAIPESVLSFNEQLERIFEVVSVGIVGLLIDFTTLRWEYVVVPLIIFFIIRPMAVLAGTSSGVLDLKDRFFLSWFGVRGIGSIYYLFFAINHATHISAQEHLINITLWTILFSVVFHGISAKILYRKE